MSSSSVDVMQKKDADDYPFPLRYHCSHTFWEEESGVVPNPGLFHFTTEICGRYAATIIDTCSSINLVSVEVVEKLQLYTRALTIPFMLATSGHALPVTQIACVPLTIYGPHRYVSCFIVPRAFNSCHIMLGTNWCNHFQVVFGNEYSDPSIFWNDKHTWLSHTHIKQFQEIRRQNLCPPITSNINPHVDLIVEEPRVKVGETAVVSTNVIISTPSVVSCDMQVAFEEREPSILQPASLDCALSLEEDVPVPTTCEEHTKDIGIDLELQPTSTTFCESIPLLLPPCDLLCNNVTSPCDSLPNSHFDHVVLITHKEILARI